MPPSVPQTHSATVTPSNDRSSSPSTAVAPLTEPSSSARQWQSSRNSSSTTRTTTTRGSTNNTVVNDSIINDSGHQRGESSFNNNNNNNTALVHGNHNNSSSSAMVSSPYGGYGGTSGMYGGAGGIYGGGAGMYGGAGGLYGGGAGMYGGGLMSPYYGGIMGGPLSSLNQLLFSIQSVIFSLGQAVQIIGMNAQGLRQLLESATSMFDHAVETWHQMQTLEAQARRWETPEDRKRRARLRAMRVALVTGISYLGYRLVRRLLFPNTRRRQQAAIGYGQGTIMGGAPSPGIYSTGAMPYR